MKPCIVQPCHRPAHAHGMCGTHIARLRRLGTVHLTPYVIPPCSVDGCERISSSFGLCTMHYSRQKRTGTTADPRTLRPSTRERFDAGWVASVNGCWLWQGSGGGTGYGRMSVDNRPVAAHRLAWELHRGPIPDGFTIDHLCHNADLTCAGGTTCLHRRCVNPDHLEPVTLAENVRRGNWATKARRAA